MTSLIAVLDHVFLPLTIIIAVTSVIGFLGNALAFYVFKFRYPSSGFNYLMATLAIYDMLACAIHMPLDIATFFDVGHMRSYLCKITCFQLAFTATGAALLLMTVAVVRFLGIHKPLTASFSTRSAVYVIIISALVSSGLALPITILFGDGELTTDSNVTARICAVESRFASTNGPISYYFILASLYIVTFIAHTCLYIKSIVTIWNRRQTFVAMKGKKNVMLSPAPQRNLNRFHSSGSSLENASTLPIRSASKYERNISDSPTSAIRTETNYAEQQTKERLEDYEMKNPSERNQNRNLHQVENTTPVASPRTIRNLHSTAPPTPLPRSLHPRNTTRATMRSNNSNSSIQNSHRILVVVIAISMTYFLSYAPHFGVMFYLFTHDMDVFTASAQSLVFELLMRSFFLNNILDPVIYGLLSRDFRNETRKLLFGRSHNKP